MQQEEEIFQVAVAINQGLEPLTFTIIAHHANDTPDQELTFSVTREKESLATLRRNAEQSWQVVEGEMDQEQADAIGAAIDQHYG